MTDWRDPILDAIVPGAYRVYIVSDPDRLLSEAEVNRRVRERGFDVQPYEDPIAFRHAYETKYRRHWANGDDAPGLVVRTGAEDVSSVPYDVVDAGRVVRLRLADVFPGLHVPVVRQLDPADWDVLHHAVEHREPGMLNSEATKDFVLRYVYRLDPDLVESEAELLHLLLRHHYSSRRPPDVINERLVKRLSKVESFDDWPLSDIVPESSHFYAFLQERWHYFLASVGVDVKVSEPASPSTLSYRGPKSLPFEAPDVKSYVDSLFLDQLLQPVTVPGASTDEDRWIRVGIQVDEEADRLYRFERLRSTLQEDLPGDDAHHTAWTDFARKWGELTVLRHEIGEDVHETYSTLRLSVDENFDAWMIKRYAGLYNQPPPVMTHHVPRYLRRQRSEGADRVAVLVVDGLAIDQWMVLRNRIRQERPGWKFKESAIFAWVPTLTSVSRQSIFAGRMPQEYPERIGGTSGESTLWEHFWSEDLPSEAVAFVKAEGTLEDMETLRAAVQTPTTKALGIVLYQVDEIMHGMKMGTAGMHTAINEWSTRSALLPLLDVLRNDGYRVVLTSDHGSVEAIGAGTLSEGEAVEQRGRRARIYATPGLRDSASSEYTDSVQWPPVGLPDDFFPLLSTRRTMFDRTGIRRVVHGGKALEEVIVPFIELS